MISAPILTYPDNSRAFILDTDASNQGIGAVLSQVQVGNEKVIAYFGQSLTKAERHYCVTRKELLAIVASVKHIHNYLCGAKATEINKFFVHTDHAWCFPLADEFQES